MDIDIITKLKKLVEECATAIKKIEILKQQSTHFLSDSYATGQPLFSQHNYKKIDDQLCKILANFEQFKINSFSLGDEAFSYAIPHQPKDVPNSEENNGPIYEMEHVEGEKPWLFMLKYKKDQRWKILKKSLMKNLTDNALQPYERTPEPGSHVLFSERNRVSRGLILQVLSPQPDRVNSVKLLDVDSNAIKFVASTKLYQVNLCAASVHSQILHCCLESDFDATLWPGELDNIFANALRDSALHVTIGKHIDEDIENTFVPTYAVKVLALKEEENIIIDINEWILKHVYPALERSNGSFHSIDLSIFDPYQYSVNDSDYSNFMNEDVEDRLTDFDQLQTETMSVLSEMTTHSASTMMALAKKAVGLSPHAAEFTFNASATGSDILNTSSTKPEEVEDMDLAAYLEKACCPNIDNVISQVFSKDECKEFVSSASSQDVNISSTNEKERDTSSQNEIKNEPKDTDTKQDAVTKQDASTKSNSAVSTEVENVKIIEPAVNSQESNQKSVEIDDNSQKITSTSERQIQAPSKPNSQNVSSNFSQSLSHDPLLYSRPPSAPAANAAPPGFGPYRTAPQYQNCAPNPSHLPQPGMRPPYYGVPNSYQSPNIYMGNQYPNQMYCNPPYGYSPNFNVYFSQQQRFNPPPINAQQVYNPLVVNSAPMNSHPQPPQLQQHPQQQPTPQAFIPMGANQNLVSEKHAVAKTTANPSTLKTASSVKENERLVESKQQILATGSINEKDMLGVALTRITTQGRNETRNVQTVNASALPEPVSRSKWSANDLNNVPNVSKSESPRLSRIAPTLFIPTSEQRLAKNDQLSGVMSVYYSPHHLYMRLDNEKSGHVELLAAGMHDYYSKSENIFSFKLKDEVKSAVGKYAACLYAVDGQWYRVEITCWDIGDQYKDYVSVFYLDYGNFENVEWGSLQPLTEEFSKYEKMATKCSIANIKPVGSLDWGKNVHDFIQAVYESNFVIMIKVEEDYDPATSEALLLDLAYPQKYENKTIRDLLLENNLACLEDENEVSMWEKWKPMEEDYHSTRNSYDIDTDDACQAVSGYTPLDDSRICKFYQANGSCWKQKKCTKEHVRVDPDVFTTDKVPVFTTALNKPEPPLRNSEITIKATEIVSLNRFYAQLPHNMIQLNLGDNTFMTFPDLTNVLNNSTNVKCFKYLTVPPAPGELVLAKHDEYWYRARVVETENGEGNVQVFFVDCGSTASISFKNLRQMQATYLKLPFQAVECHIANICPKEGLDKSTYETGYYFLSDLLYQENPLAKVIGATADDQLSLEVLVKSGSSDVGEVMIEAGFCTFREIVSYKSSAPFIPG